MCKEEIDYKYPYKYKNPFLNDLNLLFFIFFTKINIPVKI